MDEEPGNGNPYEEIHLAQTFFARQGTDYGPLYTVDGKPVAATSKVTPETHATGLVAAKAVASLAATTQPLARQFVEALWRADIPPGNNRY